MKNKLFLILTVLLLANIVRGSVNPPLNIDNYVDEDSIYVCGTSQKFYSDICPLNNQWNNGITVLTGLDTLTLSGTNQLIHMRFRCNPGSWRDIYVIFHSSAPTNILPDSTFFCHEWVNSTLYPGNDLCRFHWDNGSTLQNRPITEFSTCWVNVSNGCGGGHYQTVVAYKNTNHAHLGNDTSFCYGSGNILTLSPHITNGNTYNWWRTGTTQMLTSSTITVDTTGIYWGYFTDIYGCDSRDTISLVTPVQKVWNPCYVSFDLPSQKNDIVWPYDPGQSDIYSVNIYVNNSLLTNIPYSQGHSLDMTSFPQTTSYEYTLTTLGPCGESEHSILHKTICLGISQFGNDLTFFFWEYLGVSGITTYTLWGIDAAGNAYFIADINASVTGYNQHIYTNANPLYVKYYVSFTAPCSYKSAVKSNTTDITTGMPEIAISENEITMGCEMKNCEAVIVNISGQVMFSGSFTGYKTIPNNFAKGVYIVKVKNRNESKQSVKKFIKT